MKDLIVDKKYDGKKLNTFLFDTFPNLSSNVFYKALRKKDIIINGKRISDNTIVHFNDSIRIYILDEFLENKSIDINIIFEDSNILIINKPIGIEVTGENSLTSYLQRSYGNNIFPCHRLDRNTSGLIIFAKNSVSLEILLSKFKNREIEKHYLATVYGIPKIKKATLEAYLFKDNKKSIVYISDIFQKGYQKIITTYSLLESNTTNNTSVLDVTLETGRTHQIRAHLAHLGYPIIGDGKYGINKINKLFKQKTQLLCAYKIKFTFSSDSGILNYLNGMEFNIKNKL